ncbi:MAG: glycosyltransferase family 2 protein, partial [Burkholderiales bacterium]|nr:glycosyltransferase family 2 protein [Burkholderiales bacterium]
MANRGVSVVVPTFNRGHYIEECLDSLLGQTLRAEEIIVVDDGSQDDTAERLKRYRQEIRYMRKENGGKPSALNLAMNHVRGRYVWIFDDDDVALPDAIERRIAVMDRRPELGFVYSGHYLGQDDEGGKIKREKLYRLPEVPEAEIFLSLMKGCYFTLPSMLVRTSAYRNAGPFDETLVSSEDYDMMLRLAHRFQGTALAAPTFIVRQHAGQRGPPNQRYSERERQTVFRHFDQIVGRKIRMTVPLGDYLSPRRADVGPPQIEREALLSRMVVMA